MSEAASKLLYRHRWGQARVCLMQADGEQRVVKNYARCGFPGIFLYGFWVPKREFHALSVLSSIDGFPEQPNKIGLFTVSYRFVGGRSLRDVDDHQTISPSFFPHLWRIVNRMHRSGFVHLDLGNRGNILVREDGEPAIIDLASCTNTRYLPRFLVRWLQLRDKLGVLKFWYRYSPKTLPRDLRELYLNLYRKGLHTPSRFFRATRQCFHEDQSDQAKCVRVRRAWIALGVLGSLIAILGLAAR